VFISYSFRRGVKVMTEDFDEFDDDDEEPDNDDDDDYEGSDD